MGLKLLTNLDAPTALRLAWRTAQDLGYALTPISDCSTSFTATKGNVLIGQVWGGAPRCVYEITAFAYPDANELVLEMNSPWLAGVSGVRRVKEQAEALLQAVGCAIEKEGARVIEQKEF